MEDGQKNSRPGTQTSGDGKTRKDVIGSPYTTIPSISRASFTRHPATTRDHTMAGSMDKSGDSDDFKDIPPLDKIPTNEFIGNFLDDEEQVTAENAVLATIGKAETRAPLATAHRKASGTARPAQSADRRSKQDDDTETVLDIKENTPVYDDTGQLAYERACKKFHTLPISSFSRKLAESSAIDMKHYGTGPMGAKAIAIPMVINSKITSLNLAGNGLSAHGLDPIVKMMSENDFITHLNLSDNNLKAEGAKLIAEMLRQNHNVESLDISGNGFTNTDAPILCKAIEEHSNLKVVNLANNEFGALSGKPLKSMISESGSLQDLNLSWNQLRGGATLDIAKGLKENVGLKTLNLQWNGFGDKGSAEVASALKMSPVTDLDLSSNRVSAEGILALGKAMKTNDDLKTLRLGKNPLSEEAVKVVLDFFKKLDELNLETLDLSDVLFSPSFKERVEEVKAKHTRFTCIYGYSDSYGKRKLKTYSVVGDALNAMQHYCDQHNMNIVELFSRFDADGSMSVTHEEFKQGLREARIPLSDFQIEELIRSLDQDGDGEIDFSEMVLGAEMYKD